MYSPEYLRTTLEVAIDLNKNGRRKAAIYYIQWVLGCNVVTALRALTIALQCEAIKD